MTNNETALVLYAMGLITLNVLMIAYIWFMHRVVKECLHSQQQ